MSTSTFFGVELSRRALAAQQYALDVTGHNIANANTKGYTRQIPNMVSTSPYTILALGGTLSLGSGVTIDTITRARDAFVDRQYRWESAKQQYWEAREDALQKIERIYNEPSDNSLQSDLDRFWSAWSSVSNNPENMGARSVLRERALTLVDTFHHMAQQIKDIKEDLDANIRVEINKINSYAQQIADLNQLIRNAEVAGDNPNDLRDKRDLLIDELSKLVSVRVVESRDPNFTDRTVNNYAVYIIDDTEGNLLVSNSSYRTLAEDEEDANGFIRVVWADDTNVPKSDLIDLSKNTNMGRIEGNLRVRDKYLVELEEELNELARAIVFSVNRIHQEGLSLEINGTRESVNFFNQTANINDITAANISINNQILSDTRYIAAGDKLKGGGDGSIAAKIASLSSGWEALFELGEDKPLNSTSISDFYGANVAKMGVDVQQATRMKEGQNVLVNHLINQRESISGVSIDEEMTNLVKFSNSYNAAARVLTMMDDLLDTLINRTGVTR